MQYGYQKESLRTERKKLLEEQQLLALEKEQAINPVRLEAAARQLGLKPATPGQIASLDVKKEVEVTERKDKATGATAKTR